MSNSSPAAPLYTVVEWMCFDRDIRRQNLELLLNHAPSDATVACCHLRMKAHKSVLENTSPFLRRAFEGNDHQFPLIVLTGMADSVAKALLQFIYVGEVSIKVEDVDDFTDGVDLLQLPMPLVRMSEGTPASIESLESYFSPERIGLPEATDYDEEAVDLRVGGEARDEQEAREILGMQVENGCNEEYMM